MQTTAIISFIALSVAIILLLRIRFSNKENLYKVLEISGNRLTILAGIPVSYATEEIEEVVFSVGVRRANYIGWLTVKKKYGIKSRSFLFDSSVYYKRLTWKSTKEEIEQSIQLLMEELNKSGIPCRKE